MADYIHIGKIVATHGVNGDLILLHSLGKKSMFKNVKAIFIEEKKGSYIPYFLQHATARTPEETLVKVEEVDTKEKGHRLIKKNVWLLQEDFDEIAEKNAPIALLEFTILEEGKVLGVAEEIIEQPHQVLVKTTIEEQEVLLPIHQDTLKKIDQNKKEIHLQLPDGLLDIYLGK